MASSRQGRDAMRRWARRAGRALLLLVGGLGLYVLLLVHPDPLFAHDARFENVVLHAPGPLPPEAVHVARAAPERIVGSPFFSASDRYDVYLCDTPALFSLFSLKPGAGGVAQVHFGRNVFLRPGAIEHDRLVGRSGRDAPLGSRRGIAGGRARWRQVRVCGSARVGAATQHRLEAELTGTGRCWRSRSTC